MIRLEMPAMSARPKTGDAWAIEHATIENNTGGAVICGARQQVSTRWARSWG